MAKRRMRYADDDTESVRYLFGLRVPSLGLGLFLGLVLSFATSRFEEVLTANIHVAFFIPFVVYIAAAVGTQTQSIYARDLRSGKANFHRYLIKEGALGLLLGLVFGAFTLPIVFLWFESMPLAMAVAGAVFCTIATAPIISLLVTEAFQLEHSDPAVGAGPIATVIQDTASVIIYGVIASAIIL